jgi:hypothetical protein
MMTIPSFDVSRRKVLAKAISSIVNPAQLTMVHELMAAEKPGRSAPQPEDILFWMRLNMPVAAGQVCLLAGLD